jgi:hypothetical protein
MMELVPVEERDASLVFPGGILALVYNFNHGFTAPLSAQENFLTFLRALPSDLYESVADGLQEHYALCRAFRLGPHELNSPPTHLDLYKDERVGKKWRADCTFPSVLISANELVRTWQELMGPTWNEAHVARDVAAVWERCRTGVEALHAEVDGEGAILEEEKKRARCFSAEEDGVLWLNFISFVVFVNGLPGPLAKSLNLRSSFFDAFSDIGSHAAKTFLEAKLQRAAGDQAASQLRSETDGQSLELALNLQVEEIELERQAERARLLREQKTLVRELLGQLAKRDGEALAREERMLAEFRAALATQAEALTNGFHLALAKRDEKHKELQVAREERVMTSFHAALAAQAEALTTQAEALTNGFQVALAKRDEELQLAPAKRDDEHKELQVAREERALAGFRAALAAQAKALTDGFQAALAKRDEELRALAARDAEAVAAATEGVGAKVDVLDSRVAAAVPPTVNLNAAASKAEVRAAAPWPPTEQRASAEEAKRCIGLSGFLKRRMKLDSVSKYLGIFGAVVFAKACAAWPGERELKYVVQNARVQAIYDDEDLLEEAFQDCKPHFDDVTDGQGGWRAIGAVNDFTSARAWRNKEALSSYIKCLTAVAVVYAKKRRALAARASSAGVFVLSARELEDADRDFWPMLCAYERRCGAGRDVEDVRDG